MRKTTAALAALGVVAGLGAAALPMSSYAVTTATTDSADVTIRATINSAISLALDQTEVDLGTIIVNGAPATGSVKATVTTTSSNGYNLTIMGKGGDTDMHTVDATGAQDGKGTISTGTTLSGSTSAWAFRGGNKTTWTQIPTTATEIKRTTGTLAGPEETEITFGVYAGGTQVDGVYEGNVTLTASINSGS